MKVVIAVALFLILGALFIISENNLSLIQGENVSIFYELSVSWINNLYHNVLTLTGNVVEMKWVPG